VNVTRSRALQASHTAGGNSSLPTACLDKTAIWQRALARTLVYKRVPLSIRRRLDRAILLRPEGCGTLEAIGAKFKLADKYGVSRDNLRTYARKLERVAEPYFAGNLAAAVLGCMPASYRAQVTVGSQIILISRLVKALTQNESTLKISDLVRLSSILRTATATGAARNATTKGCGRNGENRRRLGASPASPSRQAALVEAVKTVYGLEYPAPRHGQAETGGSEETDDGGAGDATVR